MEISYGLVNLMYFMLCDKLNRIKGSRSNKRGKLLTCFANSLFEVYNNLSLRERPDPRYITIHININLKFRKPEIVQDTTKTLKSTGNSEDVILKTHNFYQ